ncbi:hypothetical protein RSAG8_06105, partial [Rhizoctonia solani AG-8 WAC10335]
MTLIARAAARQTVALRQNIGRRSMHVGESKCRIEYSVLLPEQGRICRQDRSVLWNWLPHPFRRCLLPGGQEQGCLVMRIKETFR